VARKSETETADLNTGVSILTPKTGPKVSSDYPNFMHVEMAVEEITGRDTGGPGFVERQNTFERL